MGSVVQAPTRGKWRVVALAVVVAATSVFAIGLSAPAQADAAKRCGKVDPYRTAKVVRGNASCAVVKRVAYRYSRLYKQTRGWYCWSLNKNNELPGVESRCKRRGTRVLFNIKYLGEPSNA